MAYSLRTANLLNRFVQHITDIEEMYASKIVIPQGCKLQLVTIECIGKDNLIRLFISKSFHPNALNKVSGTTRVALVY